MAMPKVSVRFVLKQANLNLLKSGKTLKGVGVRKALLPKSK